MPVEPVTSILKSFDFGVGRIFFGGADGHLFAGLAEDAAAFLLVEHAGVVFLQIHVGLVAGDDEVFRLHDLAAVLDAGIAEAFGLAVLVDELEFAGELEVAELRHPARRGRSSR